MTGDCHVRFYKGLGVKLPWPTNQRPLDLLVKEIGRGIIKLMVVGTD